ncbi:MAG: hypothetical protein ACRAVC_15985 [Trichormus sp.]
MKRDRHQNHTIPTPISHKTSASLRVNLRAPLRLKIKHHLPQAL